MFLLIFYKRLVWAIVLDLVTRKGSYGKVMGR